MEKKDATNVKTKETKLFGVTTSKTIRKHSAYLELDKSEIQIDYPILSLFSENKELPFAGEKSSGDCTWSELAIEILTHTIYNLVHTKAISIRLFQDDITYLKLFEASSFESFEIKSINQSKTKDFLSNIILEVLMYVNLNNVKEACFSNILKLVLNKIIGQNRIVDPEKTFVINTLYLYSNKIEYVKLTSKPEFLGLTNRYYLHIDSIQNEEHQHQYKSVVAQFQTDWKKNQYAALFQFMIRSQIEEELLKRRPIED